jgi:hypothetical protein
MYILTRHGIPHRCETLWSPRFLQNRLIDGVEVVSFTSRSLGHNVAGSIRSTENLSDIIGNPTSESQLETYFLNRTYTDDDYGNNNNNSILLLLIYMQN